MRATQNQAGVYRVYCGVDIAARTFSAALLVDDGSGQPVADKAQDYKQEQAEYVRLVQQLEAKADAQAVGKEAVLVVMEATGTYWLNLALYLTKADLAVSVVNPSQTPNFARSLLLKPKNDQVDAQLLARLGYSLKPATWSPPPQLYHELYQRLVQRDSLLELRTILTNQLHALAHHPFAIEAVKAQKEELLATIKRQVAQLEAQLQELVRDHEQEWAQSVRLLETIPGIGLITACYLVCLTLNFSSCSSSESLVQFAGLAPVERSSGTSVRKHALIGHGGNSRLRRAMYMASLSAMRYNPAIKVYAARLREQHRKGKEVCCAVGRKLLQLAYGVIKHQEAFDPEWHTLSAAEQRAKRQQQSQNQKEESLAS